MRVTPERLCLAIFALLACQAIFGGFPLLAVSKLNMDNTAVFVAYRFGPAACILIALAMTMEGGLEKLQTKVHNTPMIHLALFGCANMLSAYSICEAVDGLGGFIPVVGQTLIPMATMCTCSYLGMEKVGPMKLAGIVTATLGAVTLICFELHSSGTSLMQGVNLVSDSRRDAWENEDNEMHTMRANLGRQLEMAFEPSAHWAVFMVFVDIITETGCYVMQKQLSKTLPPITMTACAHVFGFFFALIAATVTTSTGDRAWMITLDDLEVVSFCVICTSVICLTVLCWVASIASPTLVAASTATRPCFAALLQFVFLKQGLEQHDMVGGLMVTLGLTMTCYSTSSEVSTGVGTMVFGPKADDRGEYTKMP